MADISPFWFVLGPFLVLLVVVGWMARGDVFAKEAHERHIEGLKKNNSLRIYKVEELVVWFFLPIGILALLGSIWGGVLLLLSGISFFFHERFWQGSYLNAGIATKIVGIWHLMFSAMGIFYAGWIRGWF